MRLLFTFLLALLAAIALGWMLTQDAGRIAIHWQDWTVQTSTSFFLLGLLLSVALLYFVFDLVIGLIRLPRSLSRWSERRNARRAESRLANGLISLVEHDWRGAERDLRSGAVHSPVPVLNYLFAAIAAQRQGAVQRRDQYLQMALEEDGDSTLAVGLARAEYLLEEKQAGLAYARLRELDEAVPAHGQVKRLLLDTALELHDWPLALEITDRLERAKLLPAEQAREHRVQAHAGLLRDAAVGGEALRVEQQWDQMPKRLQREKRLVQAYVQERIRLAGAAECEPLLRRAIIQDWDADLVRLYGQVPGKDTAGQIKSAEAWLAGHEHDPALLLTLGRLCRRGALWGKARRYLEESNALRPDPECALELAMVLREAGEPAAACVVLEQGLTQAIQSSTSRVST